MGASTPAIGHNATPSPLAHALSGAVGAVIAMALLYPLDQVRAILQPLWKHLRLACLQAALGELLPGADYEMKWLALRPPAACSDPSGANLAQELVCIMTQCASLQAIDDELAAECSGPAGAGIMGALTRIVRRHGRGALWRGMLPVLITMGVSNFVYFYCFNGMKAALLARRHATMNRSTAATTAIQHSISAALTTAAESSPPRALSPAGPAIPTSVVRSTARSVAASASATRAAAGGAVRRDGLVVGLTTIENTLASTVAGVINVLMTTPLWVSNLRIKAGKGVGGLFSTLADIGRKEGLSGLWSGAAPSLVLVSNPIIQFVVYEALKQAAGKRQYRRHQSRAGRTGANAAAVLLRGGGGERDASGGGAAGGPATSLPSHEAFLLGATAKLCSTLVTYPLQLAQAKLRAGAAKEQGPWQRHCNIGSDEADEAASRLGGWRSGMVWQVLTCWSSTVDVLVHVCRENGVSGMYQGMQAKLLHTVLTSALLFLGYERLVQVVANVLAGRGASPTSCAPSAVPTTTFGAAPNRPVEMGSLLKTVA